MDASTRTRIKICGVTSVADAVRAERLGADYIGVIFASRSPRRVGLEQARHIAGALERAVPVGVFVEQTWAEIERIVARSGVRVVQVYRDPESPMAGVTLIRALHMRDDSSGPFERRHSDYVLCDTYDPRVAGGSGRSFDWDLLPAERQRIIVAGGIGPHNVRRAMELGAYAIDVCSGVEARPGIKDIDKLETLFVKATACTAGARGRAR